MKNEYKVTKQLMKSWAKEYYIYGSANIKLFVIWCIVGVYGLFMLGLCILSDDWSNLYLSIIMIVLAVYRLFFLRFVVMSKQYKMLAKTYGVGEWTRTTEFLDNEIILTEHTTTIKCRYEQIDKIKEKDNIVIIFCNNNTAIRLYRDAFVEGSWEECKKLINSKISK